MKMYIWCLWFSINTRFLQVVLKIAQVTRSKNLMKWVNHTSLDMIYRAIDDLSRFEKEILDDATNES